MMVVIVTATLLESFFLLLPAQMVGYLIDFITGGDGSDNVFIYNYLNAFVITDSLYRKIIILLIIYLLINVLNTFFASVRGLLLTRFAEKIKILIRLDLFRILLNKNISFHQKHNAADVSTRIITDTNALNQIIVAPFNGLIADLVTAIFAIIFCINLNLYISIPFILIPIATSVMSVWYGKRLNKHQKETLEGMTGIQKSIYDVFMDIRNVKMFNAKEREENNFITYNRSFLKAQNRLGVHASIYFSSITIVKVLVDAITIFLSFYFIINNQLTVGGFLIFWQYRGRISTPLTNISRYYDSVNRALVSFRRITEIFDNKEQDLDSENSSEVQETIPSVDEISFKGVSFHYGETEVLKNIDISFSKNRSYVIVGRTGAGKSTMIDLLLRFHRAKQGSVHLNHTNIEDIPIEEYREHVLCVFQDVYLRNDSLLNNILYPQTGDSKRDYTDRILPLPSFKKFISAVKGGLNYIVGQSGSMISGGQRKLLAVNRVLDKNPDVIIFDETTAGMDNIVKKDFMNYLEEIKHERIVVFVSHDTDIMKSVDTIVLMYDGRIIDTGSHEELLQRSNEYREYQWELTREK